MARSLKSSSSARAPAAPGGPTGSLPAAPLGGTRGEALRRLQMGTIGVVAVLLLIGLASIVKDRAAQTETTTVAGAAATSDPGTSTAAADPLAEAGVVPEMPASTTSAPPSPEPDTQAAGSIAPAPVPGAR